MARAHNRDYGRDVDRADIPSIIGIYHVAAIFQHFGRMLDQRGIYVHL
jgi:hypothetical protein